MLRAVIINCLLPITTAFNLIPEAIPGLLSPHHHNDWHIIFSPALKIARDVLSSDDFVLAVPSHVDDGCYSFYAVGDEEGANNKIDDSQGRNNNGPSRKEEIPFRKNSRDGDNDDQLIPFSATAALITAVLASTVLLERYDMNNPTFSFDIDMFMALKSTLDGGIQNNGDLMMDYGVMMKDVPSLIPGDQVVGAIFGPP